MVTNYSGTIKIEDEHKTDLNNIAKTNVLYVCIKILKQSLKGIFTNIFRKNYQVLNLVLNLASRIQKYILEHNSCLVTYWLTYLNDPVIISYWFSKYIYIYIYIIYIYIYI